MVAVTAGGWLMLGVCSAQLSAAEPAVAPRHDHEVQSAPSREMLLYLAEFEDSQGQWIDPMSVADDAGRAVARDAGPDGAADTLDVRAPAPESPR